MTMYFATFKKSLNFTLIFGGLRVFAQEAARSVKIFGSPSLSESHYEKKAS